MLPLYETVAEPFTEAEHAAVAGADFLTFTSASTVRFFAAAGGVLADGGEGHRRPRVVSIGPVTSGALREHGREPDVEAERSDLDGLVAAIVAAAGHRSDPAA